jgi:hypothetical protein
MVYVTTFFFSFYGTGAWPRAYTLSHSTSPFWWRVFWDRDSQTICQGWLRTLILLISASWVVGLQAWSTSAQFIWKVKVKVRSSTFPPMLSSISFIVLCFHLGLWSILSIFLLRVLWSASRNFFFVILEFEPRASLLLGRALYHSSHTPSYIFKFFACTCLVVTALFCGAGIQTEPCAC